MSQIKSKKYYILNYITIIFISFLFSETSQAATVLKYRIASSSILAVEFSLKASSSAYLIKIPVGQGGINTAGSNQNIDATNGGTHTIVLETNSTQLIHLLILENCGKLAQLSKLLGKALEIQLSAEVNLNLPTYLWLSDAGTSLYWNNSNSPSNYSRVHIGASELTCKLLN